MQWVYDSSSGPAARLSIVLANYLTESGYCAIMRHEKLSSSHEVASVLANLRSASLFLGDLDRRRSAGCDFATGGDVEGGDAGPSWDSKPARALERDQKRVNDIAWDTSYLNVLVRDAASFSSFSFFSFWAGGVPVLLEAAESSF